MLDDRRKIGVALTGIGMLCTFLSVLMLFDRALLAFLFLMGVALTIGARGTVRFFLRPKNYKGSFFFLGGFLVVLARKPFIGFLLESYGFWRLFSAFFPTVLSFLRRMPALRGVLDLPALKAVINKIAPMGGGLPV